MKNVRLHLLPLALSLWALLLGCAAVPLPLSETLAARLARSPSLYGELIYTGEVVPQGETQARFRYQRFVEGAVSTHLTRAVDDEAVLVLQQATHDAAYGLTHFEEIHAQTGLASVVDVNADGSLSFSVTRGDRVEQSSEGSGDPVVVGPTLFGYVRAHLAELRSGRTLPIRFAVADQGRTYGFSLHLEQAEGRAFVVMSARDFFVGLAIAPMRIEFDERGDNVVSYSGRVPPRLEGLQTFDADVRYAYAAARYR